MGAEERAISVLEFVLKNHRVTNGDVQKMLGGQGYGDEDSTEIGCVAGAGWSDYHILDGI